MAFIFNGRAGDEVQLRIEPDISLDELQQLIANGITIRIRDLHRGHARLAIDAPQTVRIDWAEPAVR